MFSRAHFQCIYIAVLLVPPLGWCPPPHALTCGSSNAFHQPRERAVLHP